MSVNVGAAVPTDASSEPTTGIDKRPVAAIAVRDPGPREPGSGGSGAEGDFIGDRVHHGGTHQAVYLFSASELEHWSAELGRPLAPGAFGENVTVEGIDIDALLLGTRLQVGEAELEIRVPRDPCRTFAAHMGERGWVKRFAAHGRTGGYCAVLRPGTIRPGDAVEILHQPDHGIDLALTFRAILGDLGSIRQVLDSGALVEPYAGRMRERLTARAG